MKALVSLILAVMSLTAAATLPVTLSFRQNDDPRIGGLLGILDACQIIADIHADSTDARYYQLWMVALREGIADRTMMGFVPVKPDSTSVCITVMAHDSVTVNVYVTPATSGRFTLSLPSSRCLLIDCVNRDGYECGDTIPLMAYSPGIHRQVNLGNGKLVDAFDICGLRYSGVHPSRWHERFGIPAYIYFEAVPVKRIEIDGMVIK